MGCYVIDTTGGSGVCANGTEVLGPASTSQAGGCGHKHVEGRGGGGRQRASRREAPETWDEHLLRRVRSTAAQAAGQGAETRTGPDSPELAAATGRMPGDRGLGMDGNHGRR